MIDTILKFVNVLLNSGSAIWEAFKAKIFSIDFRFEATSPSEDRKSVV